ncbi:MAG: hypothetical protein J2P50_08495, partial [Hyphomicrobiaceae bacterium]|nr:hypothetical protein [Hyphomicrobiaceae bacterium]
KFLVRAPGEPHRSLSYLITAGDDYEVLAAVPPARAAEFRATAEAVAVPVAQIGGVTAGSGLRIDGPDGRPLPLDRLGWDHF